MTRTRTIALAYLVAALIGLVTAGTVGATADPPTLTDHQRLLVQNRVLAVQLAQTQLELVLRDLKRDGYDIDLAKIEYVKQPDPKPAP